MDDRVAAAMQASSSADYRHQQGEKQEPQLHPQHPGAKIDLAALFKGCTEYEPVSLKRESGKSSCFFAKITKTLISIESSSDSTPPSCSRFWIFYPLSQNLHHGSPTTAPRPRPRGLWRRRRGPRGRYGRKSRSQTDREAQAQAQAKEGRGAQKPELRRRRRFRGPCSSTSPSKTLPLLPLFLEALFQVRRARDTQPRPAVAPARRPAPRRLPHRGSPRHRNGARERR